MNQDTQQEIAAEIEQDVHQMEMAILELEYRYDNRSLTNKQLGGYQEQFRHLARHFMEPSFPQFRILELEALLVEVEGKQDQAIEALQAAVGYMGPNDQFVSTSAQAWQRADRAAQAAKRPKTKRQRIVFRAQIAGLVVAALLVFNIGLPQLSDYLTIKDANPAMVQLAKQAGMTRTGELLFLRTDPQFVSDTQIGKDCSDKVANNDGFIEQGCFVPNHFDPSTGHIYLREMPPSLHDLEVVTAAYEMLHPAYGALTTGSDAAKTLNATIERNYKDVSDPTIAASIQLFAKTEPGKRDNELFSLLGTQDFGNLDLGLQRYYGTYLTNPNIETGYNNQVNAMFQGDENQLSQLNDQINADTSAANTTYRQSVVYADVGNAYDDTFYYNLYTQNIAAENRAIDQYNALQQTYNQLVKEYDGQQINPSTPPSQT